MNDRTTVEANQPQDPVPQAVKVTIGRRRLLTGGAVAAPILALRSGNVLAQTDAWRCRSVSAYLSGTSYLSHHPQEAICYGRTPGYWGTHPEAWPAPYLTGTCTETNPDGTCKTWTGGTLMRAVWTSIPQTNSLYGTQSMIQIAWATGAADPFRAGGHLVAAILNLASGKVASDILPLSIILAMGNAVLNGVPYQAAPGVYWNGEQVVTYLKQTMPV